jgi:hypothetical protein
LRDQSQRASATKPGDDRSTAAGDLTHPVADGGTRLRRLHPSAEAGISPRV